MQLKVLLIEDDEDDYYLVKSLLSEASPSSFNVQWAKTYQEAIDAFERNEHDVCLLDYRLGQHSGMELLQKVSRTGLRAPVIFLTGHGDYQVDIKAMKAGAADYLVKGQISPDLLERSIRYAIERRRTEEALRESQSQLKFLSSQLLSVQEKERKRIAGELHDNLGQILSAIKFRAESTLTQLEKGSTTYKSLESLIPLAQYAIEEVRRIYTHLRPTILDDFGVIATISWLVREFEKEHPEVSAEYRMDIREEDIPEGLSVVIFRIVEEALNNVAKHSMAQRVTISLMRRGSSIELTIQDNGSGFDLIAAFSADPGTRGLGITVMKERTEFSGGNFTLKSNIGEGTTIRATWPFHGVA